MSKIKANFEIVNNYTKSLDNKISEYNYCIEKLYSKINGLENYWNGTDCSAFIDYMIEKKVSFEKISTSLIEYNKILKDLVSDINDSI